MRSLREVYAAYLKAILHVRFGDLFLSGALDGVWAMCRGCSCALNEVEQKFVPSDTW